MPFAAYDMVAPRGFSRVRFASSHSARIHLMGIYDRDYERSAYDRQPGYHFSGQLSVTVKLVIANLIVYVVQLVSLTPDGTSVVNELFSLHPDWYMRPWTAFELLTYGFLHSTRDMWHIVGNMFVLWMFGRRIEERLGGKEFLAFYLVAIVFAALCWSVTEILVPDSLPMLGASGGVTAVLLLFIFYFPRVTLFLNLIFPVPAWVLGVIVIGGDMIGAIARHGNVAFTAHLGGALFAFLYYRYRWRILDWVPTNLKLPSLKRKPPLRVHRPPADEEDKNEKRLNQLLEKVSAVGQDNLTARERRELQQLSKHYQKKRR